MAPTFAIAHVTPYPWEVENEVNVRVAEAAAELSRRGHRVLVLAPSRSQERVRESRKHLRGARGNPERLLEATDGGAPRVIAVGEVLEVAPGARRRAPALPIDVARTVEEVLTRVPLDFVHVHEPFAPSTSNAALRHSRSLNVGSFHSSSERLLSTLVARRFVESFFGRLDARTATLPATAELMARAFPAEYELVPDDEFAAERFEEIYARVAARRHGGGDPELARVLAGRPLIEVDLHMHTDHSGDCATPVEVLLASAREAGLGAIAVTDHNEISGAFEAQEKAAQAGVRVIVGEEIKTDGQGEVIGLFLKEKIPRGLSLAETIDRIHGQGGIVYVPHPFDRMHAVPDYEHLLTVLGEVDAIEIFNPRVAISAFNEEADRFAAKYRIPAGAGSDAHVPQGLGSVRVRMRDFDGPQEFLQSLRDAEILTRPSSLLYVQALKFLQTRATPPSARRASRARRLRRLSRAGERRGR
ncbi:MAG TPA: CehA/McbA family metallohydrolase [Solirubrobacteraceae bacterium]|nr:CehA/McbA family metallohydrolase [Solirubrobacteraceae bacterium]